MSLSLRWGRFWLSWRLRRLERRLPKEQKREQLLLLMLDRSLLRQKELEQRLQALRVQQSQLLESHGYRTAGLLPPPEVTPERARMDQLLGLSTQSH